jgi:hypothetical protein
LANPVLVGAHNGPHLPVHHLNVAQGDASGVDFLGQAQPVEHLHGVGCHPNACAQGQNFGRGLAHFHGNAPLLQRHGGGKAGNAAANDEAGCVHKFFWA